MYERVLCPTDGSDNAELAAKRALRMAKQYDAELHVLYVVEKSREDPEQKGLEEKIAEERKTARSVIERIERDAADAGIAVESTVTTGVPRTTIETYAEDHDIDVIVIGSTGADGVSEKLLGTASKYVVNEAPADVLVVRRDSKIE
ncbi:universal stress protein [Natronococcus sp. A-GB1]|uniref:universal stress protein n=1 Tax=Natronococcus sp. A-GB1 TaxID=3037648 RepID=UPI00241C088F|nr:universal stress protein [Natronococcus sp. A-GB1]MDG5759515.1 universal stress protein [Natronococcus sp. A-GB1]